MDGGSMTSEVALHDPFDPGVTLVDDFLHLPYLEHVITDSHFARRDRLGRLVVFVARLRGEGVADVAGLGIDERSEEHTSELQSLMRISYAVFCLKKKNKEKQETNMTKSRTT